MKKETVARRASERRLRREHILLAAERVFASRPFDEASMQHIAREAGIGMAGLYLHFRSKDELYAELCITRLREIDQRLAAAAARAGPDERLHLMPEAYAAHFLERPQFYPVWAMHKVAHDWGLKSRMGKALDGHVAQVEKQVAAAMENEVERKALRPLDTELLSRVAIAIFGAVIQHHLLRGGSRDAKECAEQMMDLFYNGAASPEAKAPARRAARTRSR